jgi:hypothetical protein
MHGTICQAYTVPAPKWPTHRPMVHARHHTHPLGAASMMCPRIPWGLAARVFFVSSLALRPAQRIVASRPATMSLQRRPPSQLRPPAAPDPPSGMAPQGSAALPLLRQLLRFLSSTICCLMMHRSCSGVLLPAAASCCLLPAAPAVSDCTEGNCVRGRRCP